jgi:hypothetical protein
MNLVQVHIVRLQALQALVQLEEDLLAREPLPFGSSRITPFSLVAITMFSRFVFAFKNLPTNSSLDPVEYTFAVSQKLMPKSKACLKNGWLCDSFKAHAWLPGRITVGTSP